MPRFEYDPERRRVFDHKLGRHLGTLYWFHRDGRAKARALNRADAQNVAAIEGRRGAHPDWPEIPA